MSLSSCDNQGRVAVSLTISNIEELCNEKCEWYFEYKETEAILGENIVVFMKLIIILIRERAEGNIDSNSSWSSE